MDFLKSPLLLRLARGLSVVFALSVMVALISCAHRQSNPPRAEPESAAVKTDPNAPAAAAPSDAPATSQASNPPAAPFPVFKPADPNNRYISSSKSAVPPVPRPAPAASTSDQSPANPNAPAATEPPPAVGPDPLLGVPYDPYLTSSKAGPFILRKKKEPQRKKQK